MHHDLHGWGASKQGKAKIWALTPLPVCFCRRRYLLGHLPGVLSHGFQQPGEAQAEEPALQLLLQIAPSPPPAPAGWPSSDCPGAGSAARQEHRRRAARRAELSRPDRRSLSSHAPARSLRVPWRRPLCPERGGGRRCGGNSRIPMPCSAWTQFKTD